MDDSTGITKISFAVCENYLRGTNVWRLES